MAHEHHHEHEYENEHEHCKLHKCMKVAKIALKAAGVIAAFSIAHEIHKVHKSIEAYKHH